MQRRLLLLMTPGIGLTDWHRIGSLQRELMLYREYERRGWQVRCFTYDSAEALGALELPGDLELVCWQPTAGRRAFVGALRRSFADVTIAKTRQTSFSFIYAAAAKLLRTPLLLAGGYVQGEYFETTRGRDAKTVAYQQLERLAFRVAPGCQVPTEDLAQWVIGRYGVDPAKLNVVDNYVDQSAFRPQVVDPIPRSVVSVGRLDDVKRFDVLIRAAAEAGAERVTLYGSGPARAALDRLGRELGIALHLPGNVPNAKLAELIQRYSVFAMCSKREGHPKALAEALCCGMCCVVTNAIGQRSIVTPEVVALCEDDASFRRTMGELLDDPQRRADLGARAHRYARERFSLDSCFAKELAFVERLLDG